MRAIRDLPSALDREDVLAALLESRKPAVFLDYDGTLTPIVEDPTAARLPAKTREAIERLQGLCPVAVVSGRDVADVRALVGVEGIWYAGSHGLDLAGPDGRVERRGEEFLPALDRAERALEERVAPIPGASVERKRFAVAVHFRRADPARVAEVEAAVDAVAAERPELRKTAGKKVLELRPDLPWEKGRAVLRLLEVLGLDREGAVPVYVGDDLTDEDVFRVLEGRGVGVVVRGEGDGRPTAARWSLQDPSAVREFLDEIARAIARGGIRS